MKRSWRGFLIKQFAWCSVACGVLFLHVQAEEIAGELCIGQPAIQESTLQIMERTLMLREDDATYQSVRTQLFRQHFQRLNRVDPNRKFLPRNELSPDVADFPHDLVGNKALPFDDVTSRAAASDISINFRAARFSEVGYFPPDSMGAIGPSQFIVAINGLIRSFRKSDGGADGVLNTDMDIFFNSVRGGQFTSDPRIRYDRMSDRWFIIIITVSDFGSNKLLVAVSDSGVITGSTVWRFFSIAMGGDVFLDYPTLGIDAYALYVGGATFSRTNTGRVLVIRKSSILGSGPIVWTSFNNLINASGEGMYVPQGVDNFDASPSFGFFIGADNARFGSLVMRRVSDPGGTPTLSGNIRLTVPSTTLPIRVPHKGNKRGFAGKLDEIDDRLMMAHIRNGRLWTAHQIGVNNRGIGSGTVSRNGCRWYEVKNIATTPTLVQAGTLFKRTARNGTKFRSFWFPSIMTSGQGTTALGCSSAGKMQRVDGCIACRFASDGLSSLRAPIFYTQSSTAYNPPGDPGSPSRARRWGDYSYTSIDPCDDMSFWTIQEYCNATNSWGVRVAKIKARPPANITSLVPSSVATGQNDVQIQINGSSSNNSGFFDPGNGFNCSLNVSVSGGVTVTSIQYVNPTTIIIHVSTIGALPGSKNVTVTNPDGQSVTRVGGLTVT